MLVTYVVTPQALVGRGCPTIQTANGAAKLTMGCVAADAAARRGVSARLAAPALHVSSVQPETAVNWAERRRAAVAHASVSVM